MFCFLEDRWAFLVSLTKELDRSVSMSFLKLEYESNSLSQYSVLKLSDQTMRYILTHMKRNRGIDPAKLSAWSFNYQTCE